MLRHLFRRCDPSTQTLGLSAGRDGVTTVVHADDHPLYRDGLAQAISERPDLNLVEQAEDGREALAAIRRLQPDVALLDIRMPELDGIRVLQAVRRDNLKTAVVLVSGHLDLDVAYRSIECGAVGVLHKSADRVEVCDAIAAAARDEVTLQPTVQAQLVRQIRLRGGLDRPQLTPREREVLLLIAEGLSAPDIASCLTLSPATIKSHLQSLYDRLGVSDRAAAVAVALRIGLIE